MFRYVQNVEVQDTIKLISLFHLTTDSKTQFYINSNVYATMHIQNFMDPDPQETPVILQRRGRSSSCPDHHGCMKVDDPNASHNHCSSPLPKLPFENYAAYMHGRMDIDRFTNLNWDQFEGSLLKVAKIQCICMVAWPEPHTHGRGNYAKKQHLLWFHVKPSMSMRNNFEAFSDSSTCHHLLTKTIGDRFKKWGTSSNLSVSEGHIFGFELLGSSRYNSILKQPFQSLGVIGHSKDLWQPNQPATMRLAAEKMVEKPPAKRKMDMVPLEILQNWTKWPSSNPFSVLFWFMTIE